MPGSGKHTWPTEFLPLIHQRLVDQVAGLTTDRVFLSLFSVDDHLAWPPADRFITTLIGNFPVDQRNVTGGGILNTAFDSILTATVYVRLDADIENRSTEQLTAEADGVYLFVKSVIESLQTYDPLSSGLNYFRRPMRIAPGWRIEPKSKDRARWAVASLNFEVSFVADLGYDYTGLPL